MNSDETRATIAELRNSVRLGNRPNDPQVTMLCDEAERLVRRVAVLDDLVEALELAHGHGPLDEEPVKCSEPDQSVEGSDGAQQSI